MFIARLILLLNNLVFGFIELILSFRIFLKFFGASTQAPFVSWIYETSKPLLYPFEGMFPSSTLSHGFTIEISALFALIIYAFVAYFISEIIQITDEGREYYFRKNDNDKDK